MEQVFTYIFEYLKATDKSMKSIEKKLAKQSRYNELLTCLLIASTAQVISLKSEVKEHEARIKTLKMQVAVKQHKEG